MVVVKGSSSSSNSSSSKSSGGIMVVGFRRVSWCGGSGLLSMCVDIYIYEKKGVLCCHA